MAAQAPLGRSNDEHSRSTKPILFGFGNPTIDATIEMRSEEIHEIGLDVGADAANESQEFKQRAVQAALSDPRCVTVPGGSALNSMRVAAWLRRDALKVAFLGAVGNDAGGAVLEEAMVQVGVEPLLMRVDDLPTGTCACFVDVASRERSMVGARGAAAAMEAAFLDDVKVSPFVSSAAIIYITAFVLSTPQRAECARRLANFAAAGKAAFAMNLSSAGILSKVHATVTELLPTCRYIFGNLGEMLAFARICGWDRSDDPRCTIERLASSISPEGIAVITAGSDATLVAGSGCDGVRRFEVPVVDAAEIGDTIGCGDSFVGGFLADAALGCPLEECVAAGHSAAG